MLNRTPFRQLGRIYSSMLALGRLPDVVAALGADLKSLQRPAAPAPAPAAQSAQIDAKHLGRLNQFRSRLLANLESPLLCVDVGARGGADSVLLILKERAKLLCFDPDAEECARLQLEHPLDQVEFVPLALSGDGRDLNLTITRHPACCSIYPPVEALYKNYPELALMTPERVVSVPSVSLDAYLSTRDLRKPDLYKLDTQGSELEILEGAVANLPGACMIEVEVEFNPLCEGQPLFADVDRFMRANGFSLWRLPMLTHYPLKHIPAADTSLHSESVPPGRLATSNPGNGQLFWGNAHYVRTEFLAVDPRPVTAETAKRAAAIASAYGYWDLALMVLDKCDETAYEATTLRALLSA